ncbi:hypothetical protein VTN77DRAFT_9404 [Rasamsonia byssochlamydoides]|uniref:uncharacterized protein n=1 Tax=Rasamsonia byssochlamydoides TaxID=89139 RepID=UPI003742173B
MAHLALASKRRRLNEAASTLSRPFKSPLRTTQKKQDEEDKSVADIKATADQKDKTTQSSEEVKGQTTEVDSSIKNDHESASTTTLRDDDNNDSSKSQSPLTPANRNNSSSRRFPIALQKRFSSSFPSSYTSKSDPELYALQKQHSMLQSRLSALRSELDTAQQALRIESSNKDKELEALIAKWRTVSQEAADELFASARERVLRMGGVKAWRERENQRREMERWYDAEEERWAGINDDDEVAELESRRAEMADCVDDGPDDRRHSRGKQMKETDDESFTMDMMLQSLNIDLDVIGFDKVNQRWIK